MAKRPAVERLDIAMLSLADGRQIMLPLQVLAEVRQMSGIEADGEAEPEADNAVQVDENVLEWRGYSLEIELLDTLLGLPEPDRELLKTVGVFKAHKDSDRPFRAVAFCGIPAQGRIDPDSLSPVDVPMESAFVGATQYRDQSYLIPDLPKMLTD
jgi:hypothetical protein